MMRILFVVTEDWYFISHRLPLAAALVREGHTVAVATRVTAGAEMIREAGVELMGLPWRRREGSIVRECQALWVLARELRRWRPDVVHLVALKPAVLGGLVSRLIGPERVVVAIAGLGHVYSGGDWRSRVLRPVLRRFLTWLLAPAKFAVIVQNAVDAKFVSQELGVAAERVFQQAGAGVDLEAFSYTPPMVTHPPVVAFMGRMLASKGPARLVAACARLRAQGVEVNALLVGDPDPGSYDTLSMGDLEALSAPSWVTWLRRRSDIASLIASSDVVCLPTTYGEGVPKILLEAAAVGRPVVAFAVPGCRQVVEDPITGRLVPPGDDLALADALGQLLASPTARMEMGLAARRKAEREFGIGAIVAKTRQIYESSSAGRPPT